MKTYTFDDLHEGQEAQFEVTVREEDVDRFSELSGDKSAVHVSREFACERGFQDRVSHGMLIGSYVSRLIGMELPGANGFLQTINLKFHRPCFPGDTLLVYGCIVEKFESVGAVVVKIKVTRDTETIASGKVQSGILS